MRLAPFLNFHSERTGAGRKTQVTDADIRSLLRDRRVISAIAGAANLRHSRALTIVSRKADDQSS